MVDSIGDSFEGKISDKLGKEASRDQAKTDLAQKRAERKAVKVCPSSSSLLLSSLELRDAKVYEP